MKAPEEIERFLKQDLVNTLRKIPADKQPVWGTMDVWHMIEHLAWPFKASNGQLQMPVTTPEEKLERIKNIGLLNDKPMVRNFNNPVFTAEYRKLRNQTVEESLHELQSDIEAFIQYFRQQELSFKQIHNIFGPLNYPEWLQFHYKHAKHHLEQFGVEVN